MRKKTEGRRDGPKASEEKSVPSLREEKTHDLLYPVATERPVCHITEMKKVHPSRPPAPLLSQSPRSFPRKGVVEGAEKITDKEVGKLSGRRVGGGREGEQR